MRIVQRTLLAVAAAAILLPTTQLAAQILDHPEGWYIHRGANNQLKADFLSLIIQRLTQRNSNYPGWLDNSRSFEEVDWTDPGLDIFPIDPGTQIVLEMGLIDPAFSMRDPNDLSKVFATGSQFFIGVGGTHFEVFPWWYLDSTDPQFDPAQKIWRAQFRFIDLTGTHDPSEWLDPGMQAIPWIPAPGPMTLFTALTLVTLRQRRR